MSMNKRKLQRSATVNRSNRKRTINVSKKISEYIELGKNGYPKLERWGNFIFLSTSSGEAWLLQIKEHLALRLVDRSEALPINIVENRHEFGVEWTDQFIINGTVFMATRDGVVSSFYDYPIAQIQSLMAD